jgi:hypothetical protein
MALYDDEGNRLIPKEEVETVEEPKPKAVIPQAAPSPAKMYEEPGAEGGIEGMLFDLLGILEFYAPSVNEILKHINPLHSIILMAYMQALFELQLPGMRELFNDSRAVFRSLAQQAVFLKRMEHPEMGQGVVVVFPSLKDEKKEIVN